MMVYLVTSGSYSDCRVEAVFSTVDLAAAYIAYRVGPEAPESCYCRDFNDVEAYQLDVPRETWPGAWVVVVADDGTVAESRWDSDARDDHVAHRTHYWTEQPHQMHSGFAGYGPTAEHARRSAEELRRQTLVLEGRWGEP